MISDAYVVKKTETGYDPAVINLTAQVSQDACTSAYNLTFSVPNYETDIRTSIKLAEVTKQIESANLFSDNSTSAVISISYDQEGVTLTDSLNIIVISDGQDGSAGRGISKIDTYYAVTKTQLAPAETDITSASILPISNTNKYL